MTVQYSGLFVDRVVPPHPLLLVTVKLPGRLLTVECYRLLPITLKTRPCLLLMTVQRPGLLLSVQCLDYE